MKQVNNLFHIRTIIAALFLIVAGTANAELTQVEAFVDAHSDCTGYFNSIGDEGQEIYSSGFDKCNIFHYDENGTYVAISPVIGKIDIQEDEYTASDYGSETSYDDFELSGELNDDNELISGSWENTYNGGSETYPGIRFWSTKSGSSGFKLFWMVDSLLTANGGICYDDPFNLACLQAAEVVTSGTWTTPSNKGLSHIVFYNSKDATPCDDGDCVEVPEPNMLFLFATALLGFGLRTRKRNK